MIRFARLVLSIFAIISLTACFETVPKVTSQADMDLVIKNVRDSLVKNTVPEEESKLGVRVSKITMVFKITKVDEGSGKVSLGVVEPVGNVELNASSQSTKENTVTIEFTRPSAPAVKNEEKDDLKTKEKVSTGPEQTRKDERGYLNDKRTYRGINTNDFFETPPSQRKPATRTPKAP